MSHNTTSVGASRWLVRHAHNTTSVGASRWLVRHARHNFTALLGILLLLLTTAPAFAQSGGQFCVRSFEDRSGDGLFDTVTEPLLTRGVSVELLDDTNMIVASALLERSPNAAQGIVCFQGLVDGTYTVLMSSADFVPTTNNLVEATISSSGMPVVVEFGAQRINTGDASAPATTAAPASTDMDTLVMRLAFSTVGAVIIMVLMFIMGFVVYLVRLRPQRPAPVRYSQTVSPPTPESVPAVPQNLGGPMIPEPPPATLDDTNPTNPERDA